MRAGHGGSQGGGLSREDFESLSWPGRLYLSWLMVRRLACVTLILVLAASAATAGRSYDRNSAEWVARSFAAFQAFPGMPQRR